MNTKTLKVMAITAAAVVAFAGSAHAQQVNTGDATSIQCTSNQINTGVGNGANGNPCGTQNNPTPTQSQPTPTPDNSTPTPTPGSSNNGGGGTGNTPANPSDGRSDGRSSAPQSQAAVLGLATTSGEDQLLDLIKILPAFASFAAGSYLLKRNAR
ncbi:MAG TPA: hypothetical protein VG917_03970 [Patescibacteria group bacterium]|nr:hypothetical protein [Patescibacteria group bacterium]